MFPTCSIPVNSWVSKTLLSTLKPIDELFSRIEAIWRVFDKRSPNLVETALQITLVFVIGGCVILYSLNDLFRLATRITICTYFLLKVRNWGLQLASYKGYEKIVRTLLILGADANKKNIENNAAIHYASISGRPTILKMLLEAGANPNLPGGYDLKGGVNRTISPLKYSISSGNVETVKTLISLSTTSLKDRDLYAAAYADAELLKMLVNEQGLNPHVKIKGESLLHKVCGARINSNSFEVARFLIEDCHVNINELTEDKYEDGSNRIGETALHRLARNTFHSKFPEDYARIVHLFLNNNADVNARTTGGYSILHIAAGSEDITFLKILRSSPSWDQLEKEPLNEKGKSPLETAANGKYFHGNMDLVFSFFFEELNVDINFRDPKGCTFLHFLASAYLTKKDQMKILQSLFDHGAIEIADVNGQTPLHYAFKNLARSSEVSIIAEYLIEKKFDLHAQDNQGRTPMHLAVSESVKVSSGAFYFKEILDAFRTIASLPQLQLDKKDNNGRTVYHIASIYKTPGLYAILNKLKPDPLIADDLGFTPSYYSQLSKEERSKYAYPDGPQKIYR